jgi:hypothetical protein
LTWIGLGPHEIDFLGRGPQLIFDHFWYRGEDGPLLQTNYPVFASRMYDRNVRVLMYPLPSNKRQDADLDRDIRKILRLAIDAPPSNALAHRRSKKTSGKCSVLSNGACR